MNKGLYILLFPSLLAGCIVLQGWLFKTAWNTLEPSVETVQPIDLKQGVIASLTIFALTYKPSIKSSN